MLKIKWANKELYYSTVLWIVVREDGKKKYIQLEIYLQSSQYIHTHIHTHTLHSVSQTVQISSRIISLLVL